MKRIGFYLSLVVIAVVAINWKIAEIKTNRAKPTISIANEYEKFGKPVEVFQLQKSDMSFSERLTGNVTGNKIILLVGQNQWRKIKVGQVVNVVEKELKPLEIKSISKTPETETGLYQIEVGPKSGSLKLQSGSVVVDVITSVKSNVLSLKTTAIKTDEDTKYVWVLHGENQADKRYVKTGLVSLYETQIIEGLSSGDKVIIRGASSLKKNTKVRIANLGDQK